MKKFKNANKGITLIALVITVIVLLILAGVALATLTGDSGILSNAEKAKEQTNLANSKEQVELAVQGALTKAYAEGTGTISRDFLENELNNVVGAGKYNLSAGEAPWTVTVGDYETKVEASGKIPEPPKPAEAGKLYEKDIVIKVGNEEISMLGGFTLSGATNEYESVDKGVVAYLIQDGTTVEWDKPDKVLEAQKKYDQFVWVPVPKEDVIAVDMDGDNDIDTDDIDKMRAAERFPMAIANGTNEDGTTKYRAVLYDFNLSSDGTKVEVTDKSYTAESSYWEPGYLKNESFADGNTTYNNVGIETDTLQKQFDAMIAKVKSNGGFWVGRYETSNMVKGTSTITAANDAANKVTVIKGTTTGIADTAYTDDGTGLNWYRMYAQQKNYAAKALGQSVTRTSSMIWGSQWDQIMIWMRKVENEAKDSFYVVNSLTMGNFGTNDDTDTGTSAPVATGNSENYNVKNIYDLAGNVFDWTLEANYTLYRVLRGGTYDDTFTDNTRADIRSNNDPRGSNTLFGSRATLY